MVYHVRVGVVPMEDRHCFYVLVSTRCGAALSEYEVFLAHDIIFDELPRLGPVRCYGTVETVLPYVAKFGVGKSGSAALSSAMQSFFPYYWDNWIYSESDGNCLRRIWNKSSRPGVYLTSKMHGQCDPILWRECSHSSDYAFVTPFWQQSKL